MPAMLTRMLLHCRHNVDTLITLPSASPTSFTLSPHALQACPTRTYQVPTVSKAMCFPVSLERRGRERKRESLVSLFLFFITGMPFCTCLQAVLVITISQIVCLVTLGIQDSTINEG
jgi:hypothetical protein